MRPKNMAIYVVLSAYAGSGLVGDMYFQIPDDCFIIEALNLGTKDVYILHRCAHSTG